MAYCPKCHAEYQDQIKRCTDCDLELVPGAAPAEESEPTGWEVLRTVSTDEEATLIRGFLEDEGIECMTESLSAHSIPETIGELAEIRVLVRSERLAEAEGLLQKKDETFSESASDDEALVTDEGTAHIDEDPELTN